jgi:PST family polysaccharide transporter
VSRPVALASRSTLQVAARIVALAALAGQLAVAARFLEPADLGALVAALAILGIAGAFSEFGLTNTIVLALTRGRDAAAVLGDAIRASIALGVLAVAGASLVAGLVLGEDAWAFVCLLPWFVVSRAAVPLIGVAQAQHRFTRIASADASGRVAAVVLTAVAWQVGSSWSAETRVAAVAAGLLAGAVLSFVILVAGTVRPRRGDGGWAMFREAFPVGMTNGASFIHARIDQVVLGAFGFRRALADYGVAYRVVDASLAAALGVATVALPVLGRTEHEDRGEIGVMLAGFVGVLALGLGLLVFWFAEPIVVILGGEQYRDAVPLLRLLAPVLVVSLLNMVPAHLALVHGRARVLARVAIGLVVVNVTLNLLLVPAFAATGAAVTSIVTETLGLLVVSEIAARVVHGMRWSAIFGTLAAFLLLTVGAAGAASLSPAAGVAVGAIGAAVAVAVLLQPVRLVVHDACASRPARPAARAEHLAPS